MPKRYSKATLLKNELVAAWKEIEASERARANLLAALNEERVKVVALECEIERAKRIAGADHAMFSPEEHKFSFDSRRTLWYSKDVLFKNGLELAPPDRLIRRIRLDVLLLRMRENGLLNDGAIHFRAKFGDGVVGYALSEEAIADIPPDILTKRISSELSALIAESMKKSLQQKATNGASANHT